MAGSQNAVQKTRFDGVPAYLRTLRQRIFMNNFWIFFALCRKTQATNIPRFTEIGLPLSTLCRCYRNPPLIRRCACAVWSPTLSQKSKNDGKSATQLSGFSPMIVLFPDDGRMERNVTQESSCQRPEQYFGPAAFKKGRVSVMTLLHCAS